MGEMNLDGLRAIKERKDVQPKDQWQPVNLADLHPGTVLACDQSVKALGLVLFEVTPEGQCAVHMTQRFSEPSYKGHEGLLDNVERIEERLVAYVNQWIPEGAWGRVRAVSEMPPVNKGKMARPEVSLLSAYAFRRATRRFERLTWISKKSHSRLICGDPNADKKIHHAALKRHFDAIRGADEMVTNEATRDALSIAIAAAHRGY